MPDVQNSSIDAREGKKFSGFTTGQILVEHFLPLQTYLSSFFLPSMISIRV
jgi:hypothetical protein